MNYALENDVRVGALNAPTHRYNNRNIQLNSASATMSVDVIGNELSIDVFTLIVRYVTARDIIYAPVGYQGYLTSDGKVYGVGKVFVSLYAPWGKDGYKTSDGKIYSLTNGSAKDYLNDLTYGTPVWWYCDSSFFVKGYVKSVERVGKFAWKINCISGIGLLADKMHSGGLYNGTTVGALINSIVGGAFGYSIANDVASVTVYGHLPYDKARANLHRVLFSCGAIVKRGNQSNDYTIAFPDTVETVIPASRVALGGSVDYQLPSNTVEITEHSFFKTPVDVDVTVFDNASGVYAERQLVVFKDAPIYDLVASSGLTVHESNVNYAIVSGYGTLTGKQYAHVQNIIRTSDKADNEPERIKRVANNELVSSVNSNNVARRVLSYYRSAKSVHAKIMLQNEGCGAMISTMDAFGDSVNAILTKATIRPTSVKGADCELVDGYTPGNVGNNYKNRVFFAAGGTWTAPADGMVRIVLCGGGAGGQGGYNGHGGTNPAIIETDRLVEGDKTIRYNASGTASQEAAKFSQDTTKGGEAGAAGSPGKLIIYDKYVRAGEVITISVGSGGVGGAANGGAGAAGSPTTATGTSIGTLTSANGMETEGYYDPIGGIVLGAPGAPGYAGGDGGFTDVNSLMAFEGYDGIIGSDVDSYAGGVGGVGLRESPVSGYQLWGSGGGGGGAAYGAAGNPGGDAIVTGTGFGRVVYGGDGGDGADALPPNDAVYGAGGAGGNGGGGAGNAGGAYTAGYACQSGNQGNGGSGSAGGKGGDGCAAIYY